VTPTTDPAIDIGDVVRLTGVPVTTLHVWERRGLIEPVGRTGLRRQYRPEVIERIAVIVVCQRSGFSLADIAALLAPGAFDGGKQVLEVKLAELRQRRRELDQAIDGIEHALSCRHPSPLDCPGFHQELAGVLPVDRHH
jgi:DNA-binding transcriptional MerR regulator